MLAKFADEKFLYQNLCKTELFHPLSDREYWEKIKLGIYEKLKKKKEYYDNYTFEPLYASLWMEYTTKKNRTHFQEKYFARREALNVYALLEAIENKGEHMERIIDLVWMTLEETEWALPAHVNHTPSADALTDYNDPTVCIFSSSTSTLLSFVYQLYREKFDEVSRNISPRIKAEVIRRTVDAFNDRDYWYMGFEQPEKTSNWTSGVNSGVLTSAITFLGDTDEERKKLAKTLARIIKITNIQINAYPDDGACNEGTSYWFGSTVNLMDVLDNIKKVTGGAVDPFSIEKIKKISDFPLYTYIYGPYFANFSDCDAICHFFAGLLYKIGKASGNEKLISLEYDAYKREKDNPKFNIGININSNLNFAESYAAYSEAKDIKPFYPQKDGYLESIEMCFARESTSDCSGLYFAAKGGHNYEMHNHNDVGTFIVYKDGERFLCDAGRGVYTALTFSEKRYTIWNNRSCYHNLPTINGSDQHDSEFSNDTFTSKNVHYMADGNKTVFSLDLQNAYENKTEINKWVRTFTFDRKRSEIIIEEDYSLKKCESIALNFLSAVPFEPDKDGIIMRAPSGKELKIFIDMDNFGYFAEEIDISSDDVFKKTWGDRLYRLILTAKSPQKEDKILYTIK